MFASARYDRGTTAVRPYTGRSPWSAAPRVIDLVTPGATGAWGEDGDLESGVNPLFTGERYLVVDTLRIGADDLRHDNAAALLAGLENPSPERIAEQLAALHRRLGARELAPLAERDAAVGAAGGETAARAGPGDRRHADGAIGRAGRS